MESNIEPQCGQSLTETMNELLKSREDICKALPADLTGSALRCEALRRRRGIESAEQLLWLALGYSVLDKSLNELGLWATEQGIAEISAPAIYERLCDAKQWLGWLLVQFLQQRRLKLPAGQSVNLEIRDATVVCRPGSQGTDWRIHLNLNLSRMCIDGAELTDAKGGETLVRFAGEAGRIVLADRIHATRKGLSSLLEQDSCFAIRMTWQNLPLEDEQQQAWRLIDWLRKAFSDPQTVLAEQRAYLRNGQQRYAVRICAVRLAKEAAEQAVKRARQQAQKNGHTPDERTLFAAQFVLVVTNLPVEIWNTQQVLALYRVRWQVELFFKRLKSLLFLDHLRARKPDLTQTYLLAKLLAACLLDTLAHQVLQRLPQGFSTCQRPLSFWTLTSILWEQFQSIIRGPLYLDGLVELLPKLQRFLCNAPRKRKQQLAAILHPLALTPAALLPLPNGLS